MSKYIIKKSKDKQFYFVLTARNGMYQTHKGAVTGILSVFKNAGKASIKDTTLKTK